MNINITIIIIKNYLNSYGLFYKKYYYNYNNLKMNLIYV